ncbi:MAG: rhamnulokinase family protein [Verrucomicrobiota bacterium]
MATVCLAVDLGAGSGRVMAVRYDNGSLSIDEIHRFANEPLVEKGKCQWNYDELYREVCHGIGKAIQHYGDEVVSVGVDTWGVDYGMLDGEGKLLNPPYQYRDGRTQGMQEEAFQLMPKEEIYRRTGIQFVFFNTLFQFMAEKKADPERLKSATSFLFMPDLIHYHLTGVKTQEHTIASTSQMINPLTRDWDRELLSQMGFPDHLFGPLSSPGSVIGTLRSSEVPEAKGKEILVILPGTHDTASAVAGVPTTDDEPVFLSSGTWSLFGKELKEPLVSEAAYEASFSNEGGVFQTTRFLKNIAGMWLLEESKKVWDGQGDQFSYTQLVQLAREAEPLKALINPDAQVFEAPENMVQAIEDYLQKTGQTVPESHGALVRCLFESLALKYCMVKQSMESLTNQPVKVIHMIGGGSQNDLLNQFAADATGCRVIAGPTEATSLGNGLLQLFGLGLIPDLKSGRQLIADSFPTRTFIPGSQEPWAKAYETFEKLPA